MGLQELARWILYVGGVKWGAYLTKEDADEVARRRRERGDKVEVRLAVEGWTER